MSSVKDKPQEEDTAILLPPDVVARTKGLTHSGIYVITIPAKCTTSNEAIWAYMDKHPEKVRELVTKESIGYV